MTQELWKIIDFSTAIALLALGVSLYTFMTVRRTRGMEKRTEVMAEIAAAQITMSQISNVFDAIEMIEFPEYEGFDEEVSKIRSEFDSQVEKNGQIYHILDKMQKPDVDTLERARPEIHLLQRNANLILERTRALHDSAEKSTNSREATNGG